MNYDEVAKKIVDGVFDADMLPRIHANLVREVAAALADAENRAAWEGFQNGRDFQREDDDGVEKSIYEYMVAKYGPRHKENRDE